MAVAGSTLLGGKDLGFKKVLIGNNVYFLAQE